MGDITHFFRDKKNLVNFLSLVIIVLALPIGIGLVRQQQVLNSEAFSGAAFSVIDDEKIVMVRNDKKYTSQPSFNIQLYSPFDSGNSVSLAPKQSNLADNIKDTIVKPVYAYSADDCGGDQGYAYDRQDCDPNGNLVEVYVCNDGATFPGAIVGSCGGSGGGGSSGGGDSGGGGGSACTPGAAGSGTICGGNADPSTGYTIPGDSTHLYQYIVNIDSNCNYDLGEDDDRGASATCGASTGGSSGGSGGGSSCGTHHVDTPSYNSDYNQNCTYTWDECNNDVASWDAPCTGTPPGNTSPTAPAPTCSTYHVDTPSFNSDYNKACTYTWDGCNNKVVSWDAPCSGTKPPASQPPASKPPASTPATPPPVKSTNSISCNDASLSVAINGNQGTFNVSGDTTTFTSDSFSGGVSGCNPGARGGGTCTITGSGTWTRSWKHCVGDTNHCSTQCSVSTSWSAPNPTTNPSGSPTATPNPVVTDYVEVADNPSFDNAQKFNYDSLVAQSNITSYTIPQADQKIDFSHPVVLYARFHATDGTANGKFSQVFQINNLYYVGPNPVADTVNCNVDITASGVTFQVLGSNLGAASSPGTFSTDSGAAKVTSWDDSEIDGSLSNLPSDSSQSYKLTVTRADGAPVTLQNGAPLTCTLGVSQILVQTAPACASLSTLSQSGQLKNVKVDILDETTGKKDSEPTATIDDQGVIEGLAAKLTSKPTPHKYKLAIKAPGSLETVSGDFFAADGTTTPPNLVLPVGDIFPVGSSTGIGRGDGHINSLDYAELKREWGSSSGGNARPGDLNGDGVVNSLDWACMRNFFGQSDESLPTVTVTQPVASSSASQ